MKAPFKTLLLSFLMMGSSLSLAGNIEEGNRLYHAGKYQEALTFFMKPDAVKNPATMNRIGYMYNVGCGVKKDPGKAFDWYRRAAEAGFSAARFNLGWLYQEGPGVHRDMKKAAGRFLKAARQHNAEAELKSGARPSPVPVRPYFTRGRTSGQAFRSPQSVPSPSGGPSPESGPNCP